MSKHEDSPVGQARRAFWAAYCAVDPEAQAFGVNPRWKDVVNRLRMPGSRLQLSFGLGAHGCRVFLREEDIAEHVGDVARFEKKLAGKVGPNGAPDSGQVCVSQRDLGYADHDRWPELHDWMKDQRRLYIDAVTEILGPPQ